MYIKLFEKKIDRNFDSLKEYQNLDAKFFFSIEKLMTENFWSLMIGNYVSSITISNHILERLLKLALIYNESLGEDDEKSLKAYNKYQGMALRNTITNCFNKKLISIVQKKHLEETINEMIRNGFSHSSFESVLGKSSPRIPAIMGNIYSQETQKVEIDRRILVSISEMQIEQFAEKNAFEYYRYLYNLIKQFEDCLKPE